MILAALALQASLFAPPLDAPLLVRTERVESGAKDRRFVLERLVRFVREGAGFRAEVRVLGTASEAGEAVDGMIEAGFSALSGRTVVIHLDPAGRVVAIDTMEALWSTLCDGVGTIAARRRGVPEAERAQVAKRIATPLRALPADRQRAMLGSLATALIIDEPLEPIGSYHPVRLPGASPFGSKVMLDGMTSTSAIPEGVEIVTRAGADVALPAEADVPARSGRVEFERVRRADPNSGMIAVSTDTVRTVAEGVATLRTTTIRIAPAAAGAWLKP